MVKHKLGLDWRHGHFQNIEQGIGYTLDPAPGHKGEYDFALIPEHPLCFHFPDGGFAQPNARLRTDLGSVPKWLRWLVGQDEYRLAFIFHDNACSKGGVWYQPPNCLEYHFLPLGRAAADAMLRDTIRVGGASWAHAQQVYLAIRAYALATGQWS